MSSDRSRFLALLEQLHRNIDRLTPAQRQYLGFFDAVSADMRGESAKAVRRYNSIIEHPVDPLVVTRARSALTTLYLRDRKYVKAYTLANQLMAELPKITDQRIRLTVLKTTFRVMVSEKRYDRAVKIAELVETQTLQDYSRCEGRVYRAQAMIYGGGTLASTRADYLKAIDLCRSAHIPGFANALRLDRASLMNDEGHPDRAITLLHQTKPSISRIDFQPHIAILNVLLAQAYLKKGNYEHAGQSALVALKASDSNGFSWAQQTAYKLLYQIAQHQGNAATALSMYKKYMAQYKASTSDAKAQAIAYQVVKQDVLDQKMQLDELHKKNEILQLRQSLDRKAAENSRLYITLLLLVLAFIAFWTYRIKRTQLRFREMARHDDLTEACNRQHFFEQARKTLLRMQKARIDTCFLILDMDHFKQVNDTHGHVIGDTVLKHAAASFQTELRKSDLFGRLGGEEFGILMPGCPRTQGIEIGKRICQALAASPAQLDNHTTITVTASIGLACSDVSGHELKQLMIDADTALYGAKRSGRNRINPGMTKSTLACLD